jgi:hypothetical protein
LNFGPNLVSHQSSPLSSATSTISSAQQSFRRSIARGLKGFIARQQHHKEAGHAAHIRPEHGGPSNLAGAVENFGFEVSYLLWGKRRAPSGPFLSSGAVFFAKSTMRTDKVLL